MGAILSHTVAMARRVYCRSRREEKPNSQRRGIKPTNCGPPFLATPEAWAIRKSGRGQPHSKTLRQVDAFAIARQRLGVRLSSAAFPSVRWQTLAERVEPANERGYENQKYFVCC